jgi:hypothetical protein
MHDLFLDALLLLILWLYARLRWMWLRRYATTSHGRRVDGPCLVPKGGAVVSGAAVVATSGAVSDG